MLSLYDAGSKSDFRFCSTISLLLILMSKRVGIPISVSVVIFAIKAANKKLRNRFSTFSDLQIWANFAVQYN